MIDNMWDHVTQKTRTWIGTSHSLEREKERLGKQGRVEKRKLPWKRREQFTPIHVGINGKKNTD